MMRIKEKREAGKILGREGVSSKISEYVDEYLRNQTPKNAVILAGKLKIMAEVATFDEYWDEKAWIGRDKAEFDMMTVNQEHG